jgi:hypothetical protein
MFKASEPKPRQASAYKIRVSFAREIGYDSFYYFVGQTCRPRYTAARDCGEKREIRRRHD